jgi:hypothetical protein
VYHLELRQFPHNLCRFNLTEAQLRTTVLEPWAREQWIELGERKWSPHQAKLTVIEGPPLALNELSMGRGWRTAQREGRDVTTQLLAELGLQLERGTGAAGEETIGAPGLAGGPDLGVAPAPRPPEADLLADSLGLELLVQIGTECSPLRHAWELAGARHPASTASESLAIAERAVVSLLRSKLLVLFRADASKCPPEHEPPLGDAEAERVLRAVESWTRDVETTQIWMRRA